MLRTLSLIFLLSGCSVLVGSEGAGNFVNLCALQKEPRADVVTVRAAIETDGHHGMFLSSEDCRFKLRIGKSSGVPDPSVDQFMLHVSRGQHLGWRKYSGEFSGRVVTENDSKVRFEIMRVHWFEKAETEAVDSP
jgi:hypothetical protein